MCHCDSGTVDGILEFQECVPAINRGLWAFLNLTTLPFAVFQLVLDCLAGLFCKKEGCFLSGFSPVATSSTLVWKI